MTNVDPLARWMFSGWTFFGIETVDAGWWMWPQMRTFLGAVPPGRMIQGVMSDSRPNFQNTASYFGHPYFWGVLESFGGRPGMYGVMDSVASLVAATRSTDRSWQGDAPAAPSTCG